MAKGKETEIRLGAEKRLYPRKTLRTMVIFEDESGEGFIYFYSTDTSIGGLFLESDIPLKIGTRVFLSFRLGESGPLIKTVGQVVRVERESGGSLPVIGMGVQFVDLPDAERRLVQEYIGKA